MAYVDFWRRWKDFSGKTSRSDYWAALLTHLFLSFILMIVVLIFIAAAFDLPVEEELRYFEIFWSIYGTIWLVPFLSMSVRRFRDAGYSKKNFWKLFIPCRGLVSLFSDRSDVCDDESKES